MTYGSLWRKGCPSTKGKQIELQVSDVFCMVFLSMVWVRMCVSFRSNSCDRFISKSISAQLHPHHRLLPGAARRCVELHLTNSSTSPARRYEDGG